MAKTAQVETAKPATGAAASKKNYFASLLLLLPVLFFLLAILSLNLVNPSDSYAHPSYGFTPQPPPPPEPPPGGNGSDEDRDEDDSDQPAPHEVTIQLGPCVLSCSIGMGSAGGLAGAADYTPVFPEVLLHVQLIHLGSGWIAEGVISDAQAVSFAVPYPGDWQVFLLDAPEFVSGDTLNLAGTNLETLQTSLAQGPLYLGVVQANTGEPQQLPCPLNCPTAAADFTPAPAALPESGAAKLPLPLLLFIGAAFLWVMAFLSYQRYCLLLRVGAPAAPPSATSPRSGGACGRAEGVSTTEGGWSVRQDSDR
jgi:hypothetical protein